MTMVHLSCPCTCKNHTAFENFDAGGYSRTSVTPIIATRCPARDFAIIHMLTSGGGLYVLRAFVMISL